MMKRLISLFLSLAMVLSLMPVSIGASAEENVAEEEKVLFAAWSDFSGYLYDFPELPVAQAVCNAKNTGHKRPLPLFQHNQVVPALAVVAKRFDKPDGAIRFFGIKKELPVLQSLYDHLISHPHPLANRYRTIKDLLIVSADVLIHRASAPIICWRVWWAGSVQAALSPRFHSL
jgi:hypothetical protein